MTITPTIRRICTMLVCMHILVTRDGEVMTTIHAHTYTHVQDDGHNDTHTQGDSSDDDNDSDEHTKVMVVIAIVDIQGGSGSM